MDSKIVQEKVMIPIQFKPHLSAQLSHLMEAILGAVMTWQYDRFRQRYDHFHYTT
ncbi:hypothetical protein [Oceanicoccus sp. KOV_DT_Chl]|uniref:hypothetical protein n=1 Tax=Oceanicoccus sp. KOV_DT_Chl TaxID=1904639 RepID=UPI001356D1DA|nr:hypothetical protein [Oceanicoccus sp. KOV_DT_Chl]